MVARRPRRVDGLDDPSLEPYRHLASRSRSPDGARPIIVEGRIAVQRALECGWHPLSLVGTASVLAQLEPFVPRDVECVELGAAALRELVGFDFHRGCLAAVPRPSARTRPRADWLVRARARGRSTVVMALGLADPVNLGAIARTARALGADLLVVGAGSADPYERRAIRASMGHVLCLPLVCSVDAAASLAVLRSELQAHVIAATTTELARPLGLGRPAPHLVVVVGNEGEGLPAELRALADEEVTIEMAPAVDSLNVAAALGILLWAMR